MLGAPERRLVAILIDSLVVLIPVSLVTEILFGHGLTPAKFWFGWTVGMVAFFAYFIVLEGRPPGATVGKRAMGIRVADADAGNAIGMRRATIRRLGYLLSVGVFYLGCVPILSDEKRRAWNDRFAHSLVVQRGPLG